MPLQVEEFTGCEREVRKALLKLMANKLHHEECGVEIYPGHICMMFAEVVREFGMVEVRKAIDKLYPPLLTMHKLKGN